MYYWILRFPYSKVHISSTSSPSSSSVKMICVSDIYEAIWIVFSFTVVVRTKNILGPKVYGWPFPVTLAIVHMALSSSLGFLLVRVLRVVKPPSSPPMSRRRYLTSVVPIAALYSLSLCSSYSAYMYLSVSFMQMIKPLMPVAVYSISILFKKEVMSLTASSVAYVIVIIVGVVIVAYGEVELSAWGLALQLVAFGSEATGVILSRGTSFNPIMRLYYITPCCLAFLVPIWLLVELPLLWNSRSSSLELGIAVFVTCLIRGWGLNIVVFLMEGKTLTLTITGARVVKDWFLIAYAWWVMGDALTMVSLVGYGVDFIGMVNFKHLMLQEVKERRRRR